MTTEFEPTGSGATTRRFEIEGKSLGFPSLYPDGSSAVGLFMVSSSGAQQLIRDSGFEVAELLPGRAAFSLACVQLPRVGLRRVQRDLAGLLREAQARTAEPHPLSRNLAGHRAKPMRRPTCGSFR